MSQTMKLWECGFEHHLRKIASMSEKEFSFMTSRSTMEAIYLLRRLVEKYREEERPHMVFIDLEKVYPKVPRDIIW